MAGAEVLTYGDDGNQMNCACVDIGTNTTRLLVAERDDSRLREVVAVRRFLRLVPDESGQIPPEAVAELAAIVAAHARTAQQHGVNDVHVVGTAAIRAAANREELCAAVHSACGIPVEVLSGEQEAELAFAGALATLATPPAGAIGVIDVGGGSCELVTGTVADGVTWWRSLPIGSGTLAARHLRSDPPALAELAGARAEIDVALQDVDPPATELVLVVGGSATTLASASGSELEPASIARILAVLIAEPAAEAAKRLGLHVERVRLLPAGLLALEAVWGAFGQAPLQIARGGLREGVVMRAFDGRS
jgi:exopolyphosphatase / guanosine-5'-triphosphate,3'-diphosphate pyrophosphatase